MNKIDTSPAALRALAKQMTKQVDCDPWADDAAETLRAVADEKEAQTASIKGRRLPGPQHFVPKG